MIHLTTVNVDGRAEDDVGDGVDVDVADAAVLLDELAQVDAVGVTQLLLHAPHQSLDAVVVLVGEKHICPMPQQNVLINPLPLAP